MTTESISHQIVFFNATGRAHEVALADEIPLHFFSYLSQEELLKIAPVSKGFNRLSNEDSLWHRIASIKGMPVTNTESAKDVLLNEMRKVGQVAKKVLPSNEINLKNITVAELVKKIIQKLKPEERFEVAISNQSFFLMQEVVRVAKQPGQIVVEKDAWEKSVKTGKIHFVKMAVEAGAELGDLALNQAIATRLVPIVEFAVELGAKPMFDMMIHTLNKAIHTSNSDIVALAIKAGAIPNKFTLNAAISTKNFQIIQQTLDIGANPDEESMEVAIRTGDLELVKKIRKERAVFDTYSYNEAIKTKNRDIMQFILDEGGKLCNNEHGCYNSLNNAIQTEDLSVIDFVLSAGANFDDYAFFYANKTKNPIIIQRIRELGAKPLNSESGHHNTLNGAIETKDLTVIQLAIEIGAKPNKDTLQIANQTNDPQIIELVLQVLAENKAGQ